MTSPVFEVDDLKLTIPSAQQPDILRGISFTVQPNETLGIVGESGSGKSMTVRALMRLNPPGSVVSGRIAHTGSDIAGLSERQLRSYRRSEVGMIFQDPHSALNPVRTIADFLTESSRRSPRAERKRAWEGSVALLGDVGIRDPHDVMRRYPHELSGGMLQRVMIASVMAARPGVILADEPTTALDVTTQADVLALLQEIRAQQSSSMVIISHDIELVAAVCDRVLVMYKGRIVESLTCDQLRRDEVAEPYTRALLACRPDLENRVARLPVMDPSQWEGRYA